MLVPPAVAKVRQARSMSGGPSAGFSLVEVLIVLAIAGVLAAMAMYTGSALMRRERANAVVMGLYGWLNEVRQTALRLQGSGCTVSLESGTITKGQTIASIDSEATPSCSEILDAKAAFKLERELTDGQSIQVATSADTVSFSPRTLSTNTSDLTIRVVVGGTTPLRCIKIAKISGFLQVGRNGASSSTAGSCTYTDIQPL